MAQRILVIQQQMIGDVLVSSLLCNELRKLYPGAVIDYMIYEHTLPVVQHNPNISHYILYNESSSLRETIRQIKHNKYDVIIDAYSKLGTAAMCLFSGAGTTIGFEKWYTKFCYKHTWKQKNKAATHAGLAIENRIALLNFLQPVPVPAKMPPVYLTADEIAAAKKNLDNHQLANKPLIMISLLGSGQLKSYPAKYMAEILDAIAANSAAALLFNYIPSQQTEAAEIVRLCRPETVMKAATGLQPQNLRSFLAVLCHCKALIGNEGGAVNMAKALDIPTFSIFSPMAGKEAWDLFGDGSKHVSVHLRDFNPGAFMNLDKKQVKQQSPDLYEQFVPALIKPELLRFLREHELMN
ncbi:glycosyltransferase family 9 protein [Parafilimonas sp.]|uniref:glycosyltransferase family 9 protein n=1 Tax=Parafilimonas sp. TaxID=1969739 RepID=UPI0039E71085